jgi:hypothetical protein
LSSEEPQQSNRRAESGEFFLLLHCNYSLFQNTDYISETEQLERLVQDAKRHASLKRAEKKSAASNVVQSRDVSGTFRC